MKKRTFLRLLSLLMACILLVGCGSSSQPIPKEDAAQENNFTIAPFNPADYIQTTPVTAEPSSNSADLKTDIAVEELTLLYTDVVANDFYPVRYVMIYNPNMYTGLYTGLTTGNLGNQITVSMNKGGLEEDEEPITNLTVSQDELSGDVPLDELLQEGSRAGSIITPYKVGDTKVFYCYDNVSLNNPRTSRKFTCKYAGTYCNIWTAGTNMSNTLIKDYGQQFDEYIYSNVVNTFGQPRFSKNGGKVNLLYYPMPSNIGGCFCLWDLFATNEVRPSEITAYGLNTDHDILHINADLTSIKELSTYMRSTMAHEFQHLICATNAFETPNMTICPTWINEAMSGYIEEVLYPGVKAGSGGHLNAFTQGFLIRNGQSLYNFTTYKEDIGVYGSVYLFSEFLTNIAGENVFSNFHRYWRSSYSSTLSDAEALANSVPTSVYRTVDAYTPYPTSLTFASEEERWMSKLTLQFHLEVLNKEKNDPAVFSKVESQKLLYNQLDAARIEGGGRIIVELQGNTFTIPKDADRGLFYIGLDKDFNPVTALIYR